MSARNCVTRKRVKKQSDVVATGMNIYMYVHVQYTVCCMLLRIKKYEGSLPFMCRKRKRFIHGIYKNPVHV